MTDKVVKREQSRVAGSYLRKVGTAVAAITLLSATSAGIAVPPVATAMNRVARSIDALGLLTARSPGVREAGAYSTKGRRNHGQDGLDKHPHDALVPDSTAKNGIAYPRVFDLSAEEAPIPAALNLPEDLAPSLPLGFPSNLTSLSPVAETVSNAAGLPTSGNGIVPGGSSGGGGGGVSPIGPNNPTNPPPPPPVPSAVPEPSGWAMMLAAFFLIGGALRIRNWRKAAL